MVVTCVMAYATTSVVVTATDTGTAADIIGSVDIATVVIVPSVVCYFFFC